ncbi:MAG: hydantoinase/oxoprolinase family protein [Desulfurococcales archaeon]|nr:hydantoinase/oxoprolinase family protein [Desulfurococcales archaeon]
MKWLVGIDIGGSFTDLIAYNTATGETRQSKVLTTYPDIGEGVVKAFKEAGIGLEDVQAVIHGTTIVINTIVERKGAKTALLTTRGFRDVVEIARTNRPDMYNLHYKKPDPVVPRKLRFEVTERVRSDGSVVKPINIDEVRKIASILKEENIEAVAVTYIHSYANPSHEEATAKILREVLPQAYISVSNRITREYREYERSITTVLNAYVAPRTVSYIDRLQEFFREKLLLLQSASGIISADDAREAPIKLIESGPVAGVLGSMALAKELGISNIATIDGGSTTTKSSLVHEGLPSFKAIYHVGGYVRGWPILVPSLDISEVGVAGNSIIWIDEMGRIRVGPRSAGSMPGPACYGLGGEEPTVTDALLLMGRLNPDYFLGGKMKLRPDLAERALRRVMDRLGMDMDDGLEKLSELTAVSMAASIRSVSIERGYDPRDFTMIAYGGSGPLFASMIARELKINKIIIPVYPAYFSAWGMLTADIRYDYVQTKVTPLSRLTVEEAESVYAKMASEGVSRLEKIGIKEYALVRYMDLRYQGQEHTITILVPSSYDVDTIRRIFHEQHEKTYGYKLPEYEIELVNYRLAVIGRTRKPPLPRIKEGAEEPPVEALKGRREALYEGKGRIEVPVYEREKLLAGNRISGPAIIEEATSTTILYEEDVAKIDKYGNIVIEKY